MLDQQIMSNIRETPQLMYRSKLKNLAVRTYVKWQELLVQNRPHELYPQELHPYCRATVWPASELPGAGTMVVMSDNEEVARRRRMIINAEAIASCRGRAVGDAALSRGRVPESEVLASVPGSAAGDADSNTEAKTAAVKGTKEGSE
ncbi:hypothetical protein NDU88_005007 [Pleurodeles waltl]|uniref:Uncharacterized protein n=1 Tax=Pleurodeles waltl TaxID=8319 RepID=A0AAV7LQZ7_PLEWA|nr:hypothetical protein NDU88_005007 [Pleurodeles waltl]